MDASRKSVANGSAIQMAGRAIHIHLRPEIAEELGVLYQAKVLEQAVDRAHTRVVQVAEAARRPRPPARPWAVARSYG